MLSVSVTQRLQDQQQQQLYSRLHPPGWCLVPSLEQRHQDTWAGLSRRLMEADTRALTLLQILIIIQVSVALTW